MKTVKTRDDEMGKITIFPPAVESFLDLRHAAAIWPQSLLENPEFIGQIEDRQKLQNLLNEVVTILSQSNLSLQEATLAGLIGEDLVAKLYQNLSVFFEDDDYARLALYFPFEFLPNKDWQPTSQELKLAVNRFIGSYLKTWRRLLHVQDVRANFINGDILEADQLTGRLPRVVKAAHLIPELIEKGLISMAEVLALIADSDNPILQDSLYDALQATINPITESQKSDLVSWNLSSIQSALNESLVAIEKQDYGDITDKRHAWLQQTLRQQAIDRISDQLSEAIAAELASIELNQEVTNECQLVLIDGLRKAIENLAAIDHERSERLYQQYRNQLMLLWPVVNPEIKKSLVKLFRRISQLSQSAKKDLVNLDIETVTLVGPFSHNLSFMGKEISRLKEIIAMISANKKLSQSVYPVALIYGSRLKGYGDKDSDIDIGVFICPGTDPSQRDIIHHLLAETFTPKNIYGEVVEFWLQEIDDRLEIIDFPEFDAHIGESYWTHILFGGAWIGNNGLVKELQQQLLTNYLYDQDRWIYGREARGLYLEELERDTLQYRLMHKGYEKFFPPRSEIKTHRDQRIDGASIFWDSGYRRLATQLFLNRVFLPKIIRTI